MDNSAQPLVTVELCAGYGGLSLGLGLAGVALQPVAYCEIEAYAIANLVAKMEAGLLAPAPVWPDVASFPFAEFHGRVDLLLAGYPCQGESTAGRRRGKRDPRWLWPILRAGLARMRPRRVFFENVEGHISKGLRTVLNDLEADGYARTWGIFSAAEIGASHRRKRVFIYGELAGEWDPHPGPLPSDGRGGGVPVSGLADASELLLRQEPPSRPDDARREGQALADAESAQWGTCDETERRNRERRDGERQTSGRIGKPLTSLAHTAARANDRPASCENGGGGSAIVQDSLADAGEPGCEGGERAESFSQGAAAPRAVGEFLDGVEADLLPAYPPLPQDLEGWAAVLALDPTLEPALCQLAHGRPFRVDELRLAGNGVVPECAAKAWQTLRGDL